MKTARRFGPKRSLLLGGIVAAVVSSSSPAVSAEHVDLKLVLATDVSGSISNGELRLERAGVAAAFVDPDVIKAIQNGAIGRIAVAMFDFSSPGFGRTVIDWRIIHDRASATAFARAVVDTRRTPGNRTSISDALELGAKLIEGSENEIVATRKVIDIAGDGPNNDGESLPEVRERILAQGIVVNGLPVMDESSNGYFADLDKYYQACVVGGRGAFAIVVRRFGDFGSAMRRKLILEISENENGVKLAANDNEEGFTKRVAAIPYAPVPPPTLLRPGSNQFSSNCNLPDAPLGFTDR